MSGGQRLTAEERVRRRPEFERAYNTGTRVHGRFMTLFVAANGGATARVGIAASRKLGMAVQRNRAKRVARDLFRRHKHAAGVDIIIVPRREWHDASYDSLEADYLAVLERALRQSNGSQGRRHRDRARPHSRV